MCVEMLQYLSQANFYNETIVVTISHAMKMGISIFLLLSKREKKSSHMPSSSYMSTYIYLPFVLIYLNLFLLHFVFASETNMCTAAHTRQQRPFFLTVNYSWWWRKLLVKRKNFSFLFICETLFVNCLLFFFAVDIYNGLNHAPAYKKVRRQNRNVYKQIKTDNGIHFL